MACIEFELESGVNGRILTIYNIETNIIGIYGKFLKLPQSMFLFSTWNILGNLHADSITNNYGIQFNFSKGLTKIVS